LKNRKITLLTGFLLGLVLLGASASQVMASASFTLINNDGAGEGFNDPTPVAAVSGNPGTTLGAQRVNVFNAAMQFWGSTLNSDVTIEVEATFDPLSCSPTSAVLGQAGPQTVHREFTGSIPGTWYDQALANSIAKSDLSTGSSDISATFNPNLDSDPNCLGGQGWDYRIPGTGSLSLYTVVLHELGHGLNFLSLADPQTGSLFLGFPDIYTTFLHDQGTDKAWTMMTDQERASSAIGGSLFWTGSNAKSAATAIPLTQGQNGTTSNVALFAPNPVQLGSSVSHWDTTLAPDALMEPFATPSPLTNVTIGAFVDMGWTLNAPSQPGVNLSGTVKTSEGAPICALVLASGQFMFSCDPGGNFSLLNLPREADGTVNLQIYADGFLPFIVLLTQSDTQMQVVMTAATCPP